MSTFIINHLLRLILPHNITILSKPCTIPSTISSSYSLETKMVKSQNTMLIKFPQVGLILYTEQFRFVACQIHHVSWVHELKEFVLTFFYMT